MRTSLCLSFFYICIGRVPKEAVWGYVDSKIRISPLFKQ